MLFRRVVQGACRRANPVPGDIGKGTSRTMSGGFYLMHKCLYIAHGCPFIA